MKIRVAFWKKQPNNDSKAISTNGQKVNETVHNLERFDVPKMTDRLLGQQTESNQAKVPAGVQNAKRLTMARRIKLNLPGILITNENHK